MGKDRVARQRKRRNSEAYERYRYNASDMRFGFEISEYPFPVKTRECRRVRSFTEIIRQPLRAVNDRTVKHESAA